METEHSIGTSRFVESGDARIHYVTAGDNAAPKAVVFLAGAGSDHTIWAHQVPAFADRFYVVAVDHRGSGLSDRPDYSYDMKLLLSDLETVVDDAGLERFTLVGYSMGGLIAQKYLDTHPERVENLVLLNCTLGGGVSDIVLPGREVMNIFLFAAAMDTEDHVQAAIDFHFGEGYEKAHPDEAAVHRAMFERNAPGIHPQLPVLVSNEPLIGDYKAVTTPILSVFSRDDVVTPPENGEVTRRYLPSANIVYLEGHHASMLIHPEEVNRLISEFMT